MVEVLAGIAYGYYFSMCGRVILDQDLIITPANNFIVLDYDASEGTAFAFLASPLRKGNGLLHKFFFTGHAAKMRKTTSTMFEVK